ncbi:MAG: hypothetical protein IKR14_03385, partial [Lachnospiraceae bacterium]|nr:hypothetical protein [Lachnospiraceae bacterium]
EALEKNMGHLVVTADSHEDIRAEVSTVLAGAGFAIFEMKEVGQSLEDVFLQMTADTYATEETEETEEETEDDSNI